MSTAIHTATVITMSITKANALPRLLQLVSPSLPIGAYSYSQGIEWAVEQGWIGDRESLQSWLEDLLQSSVQYLELPLLVRLLEAWKQGNSEQQAHWNEFLLAARESHELRLEELQRGQALRRVLLSLSPELQDVMPRQNISAHSLFALACVHWQIETPAALSAWLWSWLENLTLAGVKLVPLGQTEGQQILFYLSESTPELCQTALRLDDDDIGASSMALAIASSQHESQYTRLFRS